MDGTASRLPTLETPRCTLRLDSLERLGFQREGLFRERWEVAGETTPIQ